MGLQGLADVAPDVIRDYADTINLEPARCGADIAAHHHQPQQEHLSGWNPKSVVADPAFTGIGETAARSQAHHTEEAVPQRHYPACVAPPDIQAPSQQEDSGQCFEIETQVGGFRIGLEVASHGSMVKREVHSAHQKSRCNDDLHPDRTEMSDGGVVGREPPDSRRRESVSDRVVKTGPRHHEQYEGDSRSETAIEVPEPAGSLLDSGLKAVGVSRRFRPYQFQTAHPQARQHADRQHHHAHPPVPLRDLPPHEHPPPVLFNIGQYSGASA